MKKSFLSLIFLSSLFTACGDSDGNDIPIDSKLGATDKPPTVSGWYDRETTNCPNFLDYSMYIRQEDSEIILESRSYPPIGAALASAPGASKMQEDETDIVPNMSGQVDNSGKFYVKSEFGDECAGTIDAEGNLEMQCAIQDTACEASYE